jgi:hypothetical protein
MTRIDQRITAAREQFERDGVSCVRQVFEPEWIEDLRRGTAEAGENPSEYSVEPGDILVHHALAVHGAPANSAPANSATAVRRGSAVRWMYGDVVYAPRANQSRHLRSLIEDPAAPVGRGEVIVGPNFPVFPHAEGAGTSAERG